MMKNKIAKLTSDLHQLTTLKTAANDVVAVVSEDSVNVYARVWMVEGMSVYIFQDRLKKAVTRVVGATSDLAPLLGTAGIELGVVQGHLVFSSNKQGSLFINRTIPAYLPNDKIGMAKDIVSKSKVRLVKSMENAR